MGLSLVQMVQVLLGGTNLIRFSSRKGKAISRINYFTIYFCRKLPVHYLPRFRNKSLIYFSFFSVVFYLKCNLVICVGKVFRIEISVQKLPFSSLWRQYTESSLHHAALEYIAFGYVLWKDPQASIHLKLPYITTQGLQRKIEIKEKQVDYIMILILALDSPEKKEETHPEPLLVAHYTQVLRPLFVGNRAHTYTRKPVVLST